MRTQQVHVRQKAIIASQPPVAIVVVNWNGWHDTIECLQSLLQLSYESHRIVVVDNGSTDRSLLELTVWARQSGQELHVTRRDAPPSKQPRILLVETGANLGWAGGTNVGVRLGLEMGAQLFWLLNNDTIVDTRSLEYLIEALQSDPAVGIVGSKIVYHDHPRILWSAGGGIRWWHGGAAYHIGLDRPDGEEFNHRRQVEYVTGCSLLVPAALIRSIGLLPEHYHMYFEDPEWCLRARRAGWKVIYEPGSVVYHKVSRSTTRRPALVDYYMTRNRLRFVLRNRPALLPIALMDIAKFAFRYWRAGNQQALRMTLRGMLDFFRGRQGPLPEAGVPR